MNSCMSRASSSRKPLYPCTGNWGGWNDTGTQFTIWAQQRDLLWMKVYGGAAVSSLPNCLQSSSGSCAITGISVQVKNFLFFSSFFVRRWISSSIYILLGNTVAKIPPATFESAFVEIEGSIKNTCTQPSQVCEALWSAVKCCKRHNFMLIFDWTLCLAATPGRFFFFNIGPVYSIISNVKSGCVLGLILM